MTMNMRSSSKTWRRRMEGRTSLWKRAIWGSEGGATVHVESILIISRLSRHDPWLDSGRDVIRDPISIPLYQKRVLGRKMRRGYLFVGVPPLKRYTASSPPRRNEIPASASW